MEYTQKPKQFITNLQKKGKKGRKYLNKKGNMLSDDGITEDHHIINIQYIEDCRVYTENSIKLTMQEEEKIRAELRTNFNIWHIPAMDLISILKKWGRI